MENKKKQGDKSSMDQGEIHVINLSKDLRKMLKKNDKFLKALSD